MEQLAVLLKLVIAHLLGDFIFQRKKDAEDKNKALFTLALLKHLVIHTLCLAALFWQQWNYPVLLMIILSHAVIDVLKIAYEQRLRRNAARVPEWLLQQKRLIAFVADQLAHLLVIAGCWLWSTEQLNLLQLSFSPQSLLIIATFLFITEPVGILISLCVKRWEEPVSGGLPNAGKLIGIIERVLILSFIFRGSFEAIGFLLAAKSILRVGDLKNNEEHKKTEYILVGTLLSFGLTILAGIAAVYLMDHIH